MCMLASIATGEHSRPIWYTACRHRKSRRRVTSSSTEAGLQTSARHRRVTIERTRSRHEITIQEADDQ
jgi:hypothetical protein